MYTPKGLGAIILAAIGIPVHDPDQEARTKALEDGFASFKDALTSQVADLAAHVQADDSASEALKAKVADLETSVANMGTDLEGVASALTRAAPVVQPVDPASPALQPQTPAESGDPSGGAETGGVTGPIDSDNTAQTDAAAPAPTEEPQPQA